jgi:iron complex outermembrane recepter protein
MKGGFLFAAAIPAWLLVLTASEAVAETAPEQTISASGGVPQLEEVIVTAQKRSQRINEVGMSITAASGGQLAQQGITSVAGLTALEPS